MKAVIFHGTQGSPEGNWFPWLKEALVEIGWDVVVPRMPTPEGQSLEAWLEEVEWLMGEEFFDDETVLIGHSCGGTFVLNLLNRLHVRVGGSVIVAAPLKALGIAEFDELNDTFVNDDFDWEKIWLNSGKVKVFAGDDDPYVPLVQAKAIAENMKVDLDVVAEGGHLNEGSGYVKFEELLTWLKAEFC